MAGSSRKLVKSDSNTESKVPLETSAIFVSCRQITSTQLDVTKVCTASWRTRELRPRTFQHKIVDGYIKKRKDVDLRKGEGDQHAAESTLKNIENGVVERHYYHQQEYLPDNNEK